MYEAVTAIFDCCGHSFTAKGKRILSEGWREIDRIFRAFLKEKPADGDGGTLPDFTEGQTFDGAEVAVTEHFTQPPKPYTEDTLLSAMENAGKEELTKKMATDLLKKGRTNVKGMWSEKKQAAYDAAVILDDTGGKYINFKLEFPKRKEGVNGRK